MFRPKFSSSNGNFDVNFVQDDKAIDTNFDAYQILKGEDGFSPIVNIAEIENGYRVTITDKESVSSFDVLNGKTPIKGVDYFTEQDKIALVAELIEQFPLYSGQYAIVPSTNEQNLITKNKILTDDVTVNAIPYAEVTNNTGGMTVTIG